MVLDSLSKVNPNAPETIVYKTAEAVFEGYNLYRGNRVVSFADIKNPPQNVVDPDAAHPFLFLKNLKDEEIYGIRDYGMYNPFPADFLFLTDYVPFRCEDPISPFDIEVKADDAVTQLEREIKKIKEDIEWPLYLFDWLEDNNYQAWSLKEETSVYVFNYKQYKDEKNFFISDNPLTEEKDRLPNDKYIVAPPSKLTIEMLDLNLYPTIWEGRTPWDEWDPRKPMHAVENIYKPYRRVYKEAIDLINMNNERDMELPREFAVLERNVKRFEKFHNLINGPCEIIDKDFEILRRSVEDIKEKLKEYNF